MESRQLDALVAQARGTPHRRPTHGTCCTCQVCGWPNDTQCQCGYATDIAEAMVLVEDKEFDGYTLSKRGPHHVVSLYRHHVTYAVEADTLPEAICLAFIKAKGVEV